MDRPPAAAAAEEIGPDGARGADREGLRPGEGPRRGRGRREPAGRVLAGPQGLGGAPVKQPADRKRKLKRLRARRAAAAAKVAALDARIGKLAGRPRPKPPGGAPP